MGGGGVGWEGGGGSLASIGLVVRGFNSRALPRRHYARTKSDVTMTRKPNLLMSPGLQNVTLRYIYTLASPLNVYSWSSSHLYSNVLAVYMGQIGINRMTTKLIPCVSSHYTETSILHFKSFIFVHPHHIEIIRTRHTRVTQYPWYIEGTT